MAVQCLRRMSSSVLRQSGLVAAEGFGVGFGGFVGEPHDEGERREAEDDDREDEEGVLVAEHGGLADHLLVGLTDGHLGCLCGGHSAPDEDLFHLIHVEAVGD
jgi:hypothetical protein